MEYTNNSALRKEAKSEKRFDFVHALCMSSQHLHYLTGSQSGLFGGDHQYPKELTIKTQQFRWRINRESTVLFRRKSA